MMFLRFRHHHCPYRHQNIVSPSLLSCLLVIIITGWYRQYYAVCSLSTTNFVSIVTGANGYIGKAIMYELLSWQYHHQQQQQQRLQQNQQQKRLEQEEDPLKEVAAVPIDPPRIYGLVRSHHLRNEQEFWNQQQQQQFVPEQSSVVKMLSYEMLDSGRSMKKAWNMIRSDQQRYASLSPPTTPTTTTSLIQNQEPQLVPVPVYVNLYHVACVFGPTINHTQTASENVKGTQDLIHTMGQIVQMEREQEQQSKRNASVILLLHKIICTSSMAAVRGPGQIPLNQKYFTHHDWNTISCLDTSTTWSESYQWSKTECEKTAGQLCQQYNLSFVSLCPSFVLGPSLSTVSSYAVQSFQQWIQGRSLVQSRLWIDVRDVAKLHILAGHHWDNQIDNQRFILSHEARVSSTIIASYLQECIDQHSSNKTTGSTRIRCDTQFDGGSIPIGQKEVDSIQRIYHTFNQYTLRANIKETLYDMVYQQMKVLGM
jgi:nucleoside-diphosphate-sugar epimerase